MSNIEISYDKYNIHVQVIIVHRMYIYIYIYIYTYMHFNESNNLKTCVRVWCRLHSFFPTSKTDMLAASTESKYNT